MLPSIIVGLITLMGISMVADMVFDQLLATREAKLQSEIRQMRLLQSALIDAEDGVRGYIISGQVEYLAPYLAAVKILAGASPALLSRLDERAMAQPHANRVPSRTISDLAGLRAAWEDAIGLQKENQGAAAGASLVSANVKTLMDRLRDNITGTLDARIAEAAERRELNAAEQRLLNYFNLGCAVIAIIAMIYAFGRITRAIATGFVAKQQVEQLFVMTDMLQSAAGQDDTNEVFRSNAATLLPGFSGTLYVFNNSHDRLDLSTQWGELAQGSADYITPDSCWALKRGKPHMNRAEAGTLRCTHAIHGQAVLEIPMAARGQLYGLLGIIAEGADATARLDQFHPIASAIADAMSLALANIALRERLCNQALRDSLTGLYNRRFLEEIQERMCIDAERRKTSISAIMIDLDHFKKLNDQHGHAAGDAVLREVAAAIMSCLRSVDVACRYGGEELAVLLPDCPMANAAVKAEQIRARIAELTLAGGAVVTASLGVASIPETCGGVGDLLPTADAALYQAKQQGRNRVVAATIRPSGPRLNISEAGATLRPAG